MAQILFVDDEPSVLSALRRTFRNNPDLECHFANSPAEAIGILAEKDISVIVSDHKMPQMTGAEFLARVKEKRPSTVRIMLTGQADLEDVTRAVNSGEIFRFILKPWSDEELKQAIDNALQLHAAEAENARLVKVTTEQNVELSELNTSLDSRVRQRTEQLGNALHTANHLNQVLEESLLASARVFFTMLEMAKPALGSHARRVADHARAFGAILGIKGKQLDVLEIAGLLHDVGKLGLPPFLQEKGSNDLKPQEIELYRSHPATGAEQLKSLVGYETICEIIGSHHEHYNGDGFPKGVGGCSVTQEAYAIGLCNELDHFLGQPGGDPEFKLQYAFQRIADSLDKQFPGAMVQAALEYIETLQNESADTDVLRVTLDGLVPNMTLAANIYSMSGALLLAKGATVTGQRISRIRAIAKLDPVAGDIVVYPKRQPARSV